MRVAAWPTDRVSACGELSAHLLAQSTTVQNEQELYHTIRQLDIQPNLTHAPKPSSSDAERPAGSAPPQTAVVAPRLLLVDDLSAVELVKQARRRSACD